MAVNTKDRGKVTQVVFVVDAEGRPCLPTHPARARKLLKTGKATVKRMVPFTIQLSRKVENPVGDFTINCDDGSKYVGVVVVNEHKKEIVFRGVIRLRQDVSRRMTQRRQYRRNRRYRKVRHRKPGFDNRKQLTPPPSIRQKKESVYRVIRDLSTIMPVKKVNIEDVSIDISSLVAGHPLAGTEYQVSPCGGKSTREKVLNRDSFTCQRCGTAEDLEIHHIVPRSKGGTNTLHNLITLCQRCHEELHRGVWELNVSAQQFRHQMHVMQGKTYLRDLLASLGLQVNTVPAFLTSSWRKSLGLEKSHSNDAIAMGCRIHVPEVRLKEYLIIPKRAKVWEDNPTRTREEKNGFRHWDLVKAFHRTKGTVIGVVRSLKKREMTLRTQFDDNFPVSYRKSRLLWRFNSVVYI